ncbi:MAG: class I mannose-6-phosphate isomerase [Pirellulales bacterium]|nr:class I mannose-6-phosphate isomerase [Pirellulales bacterium]
MIPWHPLRFRPLYKQYLWGGQKLRTVLDRPLDPNGVFAESWEVCDHGADQSVVLAGPLTGRTLRELVVEHGRELLGDAGWRARQALPSRRFPLLLKYLDARQDLSLQVHPNDAMAARLDPPDLGKTEAWVVLESEPGSVIYAGLKPGVDRPALAKAIDEGTCADCLHQFEAQPGDCLLIPAGMVHSLGRGNLVVEIQQSSDTTFRLFDWNRLGPDGKPRALHVQQGLDAVDFRLGPGAARRGLVQPENGPAELARCHAFVLHRHALTVPRVLGGDDRFRMLTVLEGALTLDGDPLDEPLARGGSALLPAAAGPVRALPRGRAVFLETHLP